MLLKQNEDVEENSLAHKYIFKKGKQAVAAGNLLAKPPGEESLDFTGVDTSERLGAVRLRKV